MCCLTVESAPWFLVGLSCNKRIITWEYPKLKMDLAQQTCKQAWLYHKDNLLLLSPPLWLLGDRVGMSHYTVLHCRKVCYSCSLGKITIRNFSYSFTEYIYSFHYALKLWATLNLGGFVSYALGNQEGMTTVICFLYDLLSFVISFTTWSLRLHSNPLPH